MSGKVITFIKSGGGTGATTLAVQMACAAAGRTLALLDLDVQYGSAAYYLDQQSTVSILELAAAADRLDESLLKGAMVRPYGLFDMLAAPDGVYPLEDVSSPAVLRVIAAARAAYDVVLIDLPPVWNEWSYTALAQSDCIVLVTAATLPSLRQARRQIEMTRREMLGNIPLLLVANGLQRPWCGPAATERQAERALGRKIDVSIPADRAFKTATAAGVPLRNIGAKALVKKLGATLEMAVARSQPVRDMAEA